MLTIDISVNGKTVAHAFLRNISDLADLSSYEVVWGETPAPHLDIERNGGSFILYDHPRKSSVWSLLGKIAPKIMGDIMVRQARERKAL